MLKEFKSSSSTEYKLSESGEVEATFSTFDVVDRDGDIVARSALAPFDGSEVPMVWAHQWDKWVGRGTLEVGTKYAKIRGQFALGTTAGREAYEQVKALQGVSQWSWSFQPKDVAYEERDGKQVRVIKGLSEPPFEVSPVLVGAGLGTRTNSVKAMLAEDDETRLREIVREEVAKALAEVKSVPAAPVEPDAPEPLIPPTPQAGESQDDFMARAMSDPALVAEYEDVTKRAVAGLRLWEAGREEAGKTAADSVFADFLKREAAASASGLTRLEDLNG